MIHEDGEEEKQDDAVGACQDICLRPVEQYIVSHYEENESRKNHKGDVGAHNPFGDFNGGDERRNADDGTDVEDITADNIADCDA